MVIDSNMYWIPEELFRDDSYLNEFLRTFPKAYDVYAFVKKLPDGRRQIVVETPKGFPGVNYTEGEYLLEMQLQDMQKAGVDEGILKIPCCHEWMTLELCRKFNDGMARHAKKSNGKLHALAVIPPWGDAECIYELERCVKELGMTGVQLSAHYGNLYLDDEVFRPFFEKLNEWNLTGYVHHTPVPVENKSLCTYNNLRRSYGRCADQMTAVGREIFSDLFERYPKVKLVHSMLGGGFPAYVNLMLPHGTEDRDQRFDYNTDRYYGYLKRNIYFETSHAQPWGMEWLENAVKNVGADHIIYGSSYPVKKQEWMLQGPAFVKELKLGKEEKEQILCKNAKRIYQLQ